MTLVTECEFNQTKFNLLIYSKSIFKNNYQLISNLNSLTLSITGMRYLQIISLFTV